MFTAWFGEGAAPAPATLVGPLNLVGETSVASEGPVAWAMAGPGTYMAHDPDTGIRVWAWARLDNRAYLRAHTSTQDASDAALLLSGYLRWGTALAQHLTGDFSVCIFDPRDGSIHAFRDPIGVRPLTVGRSAGITVVTTAAGSLWNLPGFVSTPDARTIVEHVTQLRGYSMASAHPQATRVIPGTVLSCRSGACTEDRYHRFDRHSEWSRTPSNQWVYDFRAVLDAAVVARLPAHGPIGLEFSGGLDSVGIASLIKDTDLDVANRLWAYGMTLLSEEEKTMRTSAEILGITKIYTGVPQVQQTTVIDTESLLGEPVGHEISLRFSQPLSQCADAGGEVMFAGHGGDQCATHFARQAPHEWVRHHDVFGAARYVLPRSDWRQVAHTVKLAAQGTRFKGMTLPSPEEVSRTLHLRIDVIKDVAVMERLTRAYEPFNAPSVNADIVTADGLIQPLTAAYWSRRAEECNTVASLFGMTYAFPLLDTAVVQQYLKTPTVHKYRHGLGRYLFREALGDSMPEFVRWAPSKYMGEPIRRQSQRPKPATVAGPVHPLLADLMPAGAGLPPPSKNWGYPNQVRRVNGWLNAHFPAST